LSAVTLESSKGKTRLFVAVPSLDTPVCDQETRKFNEAVAGLAGVQTYVISMDLPFAQKRWCGAAGIDRVITLSDHREASFGLAYGVLIKELRLLARTIFILDKEGIIRYVQLVKETTHEPNYEEVLKEIQKIL
jgi:thiol peroxidase